MSPSIESGTKRNISFPERKTRHPGIRKRPRYLTSWEESFRRLPNIPIEDSESISSSTTNKTSNRFGLADLFGHNRWATKPSQACGIRNSDKPSKFFTLRVEHRRGGALAKHAGEERILLFRSDQAGAIAKIIFSSTPVGYDSNGDARKQKFATAANAKIHVLFVKDDYRGYSLGGLLFVLCTKVLQERYYDEIYPTSSIHCVLDAEEDIRRHGKLVHFYEHLGLRKRKRAKATFINNNNGVTYCRIPMNIDLLVSSSNNSGIPERYTSFLPALLASAIGEVAKVDNQNIDSWLFVECQDGTIELRTCDGRSLQQDGQGRCKILPTETHSTSFGSFQLLRVSDKLDKVLLNKDDEYSTNLRQQDQNTGKEKELWMLQSRLHGTFLGLACDNNLMLSIEASFWQVDENFCLTHTTDSPARRQHYRRMWKTQGIAYVSKMREKYLRFQLCSMTIDKALHLTKHLLANPFSMSIGDGACNGSRPPSVRTLLFHTAELARKEGHPDWVQFVALIHGLAGALRCLKFDGSGIFNLEDQEEEDSDFDWTIPVDARVLGCKASRQSIFQEFRNLDPDKDDPRYNKNNGAYKKKVGLENVLMSWSTNEYMYHMLKHNDVMLPMEAYAILRLFPLVDWHKWGNHGLLANEDDEEVKPFVADIYDLFQRSRDAMMSNRITSKEMTENESTELWTNHYALIANKYGAGGILEW